MLPLHAVNTGVGVSDSGFSPVFWITITTGILKRTLLWLLPHSGLTLVMGGGDQVHSKFCKPLFNKNGFTFILRGFT